MVSIHVRNRLSLSILVAFATLLSLSALAPRAHAESAFQLAKAESALVVHGAQSDVAEALPGEWHSLDEGDSDVDGECSFRLLVLRSGRVALRCSPANLEFSLSNKAGEKYLFNDEGGEVRKCDLRGGLYYLSFPAGQRGSFVVDYESSRESFADQTSRNNTLERARRIDFERPYRGQLAINDRVDVYKLRTTGLGAVRVTASSQMEATEFQLLNAHGKLVDSAFGRKGHDADLQRLSWTCNVNKRTYYLKVVRVSDGDGYTGPYRFRVEERPSISAAQVSPIEGQVYTGKAIEPEVEVVLGGDALVAGTDYAVRYENNADVGVARVVLTGKGDYAGTKIVKFKIVRASLEEASVGPVEAATYTGKKITPKPKVTLAGKVLKLGRDYTVRYSNNKNAGVAKAVFKGMGNFKGKKTFEFTIKRASLKNARTSAVKAETYTGKKHAPRPTVSLAGKKLKLGRDYTLSYARNKDAGTAKVTVRGKGNYADAKVVEFTIGKANLKKAKVGSISAKTYTGKSFRPKPTVKLAGKKLKFGRDYRLRYANNKKPGTAKVTVIGKGNFTGKKTVSFKIKKPPRTVSASKVYGPILDQAENATGKFAELLGPGQAGFDTKEYVLYDIDKDGAKEMLVQVHTYMYQMVWSVYTVRGGEAVFLGRVGNRAYPYRNAYNLYLFNFSAGMGLITRVNYSDGGLHETRITLGTRETLMNKLSNLGAWKMYCYDVTDRSALDGLKFYL